MAFSFNFYDDPAPKAEEEGAKVETSKSVQSVTLEDALQQLPDTLAYSLLGGLPRRELWHVKMQIMQNDQDTQLLGQWDVITGSYEGGLKTWECSVDLAEYLSHQTYGNELSILEVACRLYCAKLSLAVDLHCQQRCYSRMLYETRNLGNLFCRIIMIYSTLSPCQICFLHGMVCAIPSNHRVRSKLPNN